MIAALMHGKLSREQENMEDVLTSIVFGMLQYAPAVDGLLPFLARAQETVAGDERPLAGLGAPRHVAYEFWPWIHEAGCSKGCEPDVVVRLVDDTGAKTVILIEAKYRSGKSSEADDTEEVNDQLAREWANVRRVAEREGATPWVLYLTAGFAFPRESLDEAQKDLAKSREAAGRFCWLSWRHLPGALPHKTHQCLDDLADLVDRRLGLGFFDGVAVTAPEPGIIWSFRHVYEWQVAPVSATYGFAT